jgi:ATP phosphoribosyltransferase regulatory subunit
VSVDLAEFADFSPLAVEARARDLRPYYEGPVFRAYLPGLARPVAGGGRYDRLFRTLGAPAAAIGFSLQLDSLAGAAAAGEAR